MSMTTVVVVNFVSKVASLSTRSGEPVIGVGRCLCNPSVSALQKSDKQCTVAITAYLVHVASTKLLGGYNISIIACLTCDSFNN